ncbi:unnamed protein product [Pocillopora meandrina]|uniref:Uncharacterized protein n=1 Tax=Pocillopora meandrina TaxID=46732 RepID=A0AAU9XKD0_9CNID|nr:unnamed protein product [Pocillopora meandrina]
MDHSFTEMKGTLGNLAYVEESANEEGSVNSDTEKETDKAPNKDSASTNDQHLSGSSNANNVNNWLTLTNNTSPTDPKSFKEENSTLAGIAIEQLFKVQDKISEELPDIPSLIRKATDSVTLLGAADFGLNMQRRDNIKPELNAD